MLAHLVDHFTVIEIPYMVVGSLASSALSVARTTFDGRHHSGKTRMVKMYESERQYRDVVQVARVQKSTLDRDYLSLWARNLGIEELYNKLLSEPALNDSPPQ